jgi:uncharacterized protein (UPF0332 family)
MWQIARAEENLAAAKQLFNSDYYNAAANRLYYAVFQLATYLLEQKGKKPSDFTANASGWKHEMIRANAYCLRDNEEDKKLVRELQGMREKADYKAAVVEREEIEDFLPQAEKFFSEVANGQK